MQERRIAMSFDRRQKIKQLLESNGIVMLRELATIFPSVSSMTLRRDLEYFERAGEAIRIRGGARSVRRVPSRQEDIYSLRASMNQQAKEQIAEIAVEYIETGRSVFLDSGTTVMQLARILPDLNLSILTSGPNISLEVVKRHNPTVNLIGGMVSRDNLSVSGMQALEFVRHLNFDIAFMVASAFSLDNGFSCGNYSEFELKRLIINKARKTIMLLDSSKFDKSMPFTFAGLSDIDVLITDCRPQDNVLSTAKEHGIEIRFSDQEPVPGE